MLTVDLVKHRVLKYVISGVIASLVMFISLIFFRETLGIWYLYSSTLAFVLAFFSSFLLQKLWTFRNISNSETHKQLVLFFVVSIINLGLNAFAMFVLVDIMNIWYILSQFFVTALIAIWSFFIYRIIFV